MGYGDNTLYKCLLNFGLKLELKFLPLHINMLAITSPKPSMISISQFFCKKINLAIYPVQENSIRITEIGGFTLIYINKNGSLKALVTRFLENGWTNWANFFF